MTPHPDRPDTFIFECRICRDPTELSGIDYRATEGYLRSSPDAVLEFCHRASCTRIGWNELAAEIRDLRSLVADIRGYLETDPLSRKTRHELETRITSQLAPAVRKL